ncbi:RNase H domain-containing protein [Trichonephila clavipes]|nr:RNase H domain-containing protein [Trichonephila clavipes]
MAWERKRNSTDLRKRMKYRIKLLSDLRQRFRKEYLSELIQKQNDNRVREPRIGEMVLIGNDNKKRLSWPIAKIMELIPGRDGEIRTVRLKTQHGTVIRPVQRIFPLEVQAIANSDKELKEESVSVKTLDRHPIHLQWVPSHVGLLGNEVADDLAKASTSNPGDPKNYMVLTSTEIYSRAKELICRTWVVPPVHPWYFQRHPGSTISFKGSRSYQTAFSRFSTGHLRCMNFEGGKRSFPICPKCNISQFSPLHILQCLGFSCEEAVASPCYS